jgi:GTP-binding protein
VPEPKQIAKKDKPFQILNVLIENDPFLGRLLTGRIESGKAVPGMAIHALDRWTARKSSAAASPRCWPSAA